MITQHTKDLLVNREVTLQWRNQPYIATIKGRLNAQASVIPVQHAITGEYVYPDAPSFAFSWETVERVVLQGHGTLFI